MSTDHFLRLFVIPYFGVSNNRRTSACLPCARSCGKTGGSSHTIVSLFVCCAVPATQPVNDGLDGGKDSMYARAFARAGASQSAILE